MAVLHADLVGALLEGWNSRNQRGFQYILLVVYLAIRYLWLLPLHHKTAEAVATALFDEVISSISMPSAIINQSIKVICNARNVVHKLESEARAVASGRVLTVATMPSILIGHCATNNAGLCAARCVYHGCCAM